MLASSFRSHFTLKKPVPTSRKLACTSWAEPEIQLYMKIQEHTKTLVPENRDAPILQSKCTTNPIFQFRFRFPKIAMHRSCNANVLQILYLNLFLVGYILSNILSYPGWWARAVILSIGILSYLALL